MTCEVIFDMPAEEYHAIDAMSASAIHAFLRSPFEFYARYVRGWEPPPNKAMTTGTLYHAANVEGAFSERYCVAPDPKDFPGALTDTASYQAACKERGLKAGGTKAEMKARLLEFDPALLFWDDVLEEQRAGRVMVEADQAAEMWRAMGVMSDTGLLSLFDNGAPEVTILWDDDTYGVKAKARIDYLRVLHGRLTEIDYKTFSNSAGKDIDTIIAHKLMYDRIGLQRAWYLRALDRVLASGSALRHLTARFDATLATDGSGEPRSILVFQQTGPIPTPAVREYVRRDHAQRTTRYYSRDITDIDYALDRIDYWRTHFGDATPWGYLRDDGIKALDDADFPAFYLTPEE